MLNARSGQYAGNIVGWYGYGWYGYEIDGLLAGPESYTRQVLEVGASWSIGGFDLDLQAERRFGDAEDAYSLAFYVQWRF